jgi:hypothetical protein
VAAKEVIYFQFEAQLSTCSQFAARLPPEPLAESPQQTKIPKQIPGKARLGVPVAKGAHICLSEQMFEQSAERKRNDCDK